MIKKIFIAAISIIICSAAAYSFSFKAGGFFGAQQSYKNKYSNAPIGYIEHTLYAQNGFDIRTSLGITYLESTNFENSSLYGYFETAANTFPLNTNPTGADTYGVFGPYNSNSKLLLAPFKIQASKYFKLSKKPDSPEISFFSGITIVYYLEKYEQFTDSNDALKTAKTFIDKKCEGINFGLNLGTGIKLSKNVAINTEYNIIKSTKFHTGLNNFEFYFRIDI
ncbi:hypothetical protein KA977_06425 [Candidatus Dependentiae bacterium]|nr:hypothetical protein [Candidatus Dependentiae bacterium]